MKATTVCLLVIAILHAFPARGNAAYIALRMRPSARFANGRITATVRITNRGNEAAGNVWTEAMLGDTVVESSHLPALAPDETHAWEIDMGTAPALPGVHALVFRAHYLDSHGHPFSALHTIPLFTADVTPDSGITAELTSLELDRTGTLELTVSSRHADPVDVECRLMLPDEITCPRAVYRATVSPSREATHRYTLHNVAALPGSRSRVFAVIRYRHASRGHAAIAAATVRVRRYPWLSRRARNVWIGVIAILLVAFVAAQFLPRRERAVER